MRGIQRYLDIPDNADKVLFAEDFVNHFMLRFNLPLLSSGIADHRAVIYNAFNSEVKLAANYFYTCLEEEISEEFENILNQNGNYVDINAFLKYAIPLKFNACVLLTHVGVRNLMIFCVKISTIAAKSYALGLLDAPLLAVDYIQSLIKDIDMVGGGWVLLNSASASYAQQSAEMDDCYLTPEISSSDFSDSLSTLSSKDTESSSSPDHEMNCGEGQEELSDGDYHNLCIASSSSSVKETVSFDTRNVEKSNDVEDDNTTSFSRSTSDSGSSKSSKHNHLSTSFHSFEVTPSEDDGSEQKTRKELNTRPSCSHSKESDSDSDKCEKELKKTTERVGTFNRQMTEKRSAILSSPVHKLHESDSADHFKIPDSNSSGAEDLNESSVAEGDRVQSSRTKLSPLREPIPKRRK